MNFFEMLRRATGRAPVRRRPSRASIRTGRAARTPLAAGTETLSSPAQAWLRELPAALRPHHLCGAYPRVANRIALCWNDLTLVDVVFNELLLDRRGGRTGFPSAVAAELLRLHAFHERRLAAAGLRRSAAARERQSG